MTPGFLGCIADDFTGATDLANNLVRAGLRVIQTIGVPDGPLDDEADAVVVALKTRTVQPALAVTQSLAALAWLRHQGARQIYFKYCSTFDSTAKGNIGPVTDALMDALGTDFTIACPAFPETGRTVFKGHLFVGDEPLHESGMRNHPLTPMTDSNLVRVLQAQTRRKVGLIDYRTVGEGAGAISRRMAALKDAGVAMAVVDAICNDDLHAMGPALSALPLITAGSGVAIGLTLEGRPRAVDDLDHAGRLPAPTGLRAIVSGSCSTATNAQVADFLGRGADAFAVDPLALAAGREVVVAEALAWAEPRVGFAPVLIHATAEPGAVRLVQQRLGGEKAGELVEQALAAIAKGLVRLGVRQLIVAGGETSGACVQALGITRMRIGTQIAPGVPWCHATCHAAPEAGLHIALKSGNFGAQDFFTSAFGVLAS